MGVNGWILLVAVLILTVANSLILIDLLGRIRKLEGK